MIGAVHYKLDAFGNGAKLADDQFVAYERIKMGNVFFKVLAVCLIIVIIGIVADNDVRILYHILDKANAGKVGIRMYFVFVRSNHLITCLNIGFTLNHNDFYPFVAALMYFLQPRAGFIFTLSVQRRKTAYVFINEGKKNFRFFIFGAFLYRAAADSIAQSDEKSKA